MDPAPPPFSADFQRLYCDADLFAVFSAWHPVSFQRVLLQLGQVAVVDDPRLIAAEALHLANRNDSTRRAVVDAYRQCGLLSEADADSLKPVVDYFDADFFELMGDVHVNAGAFICALRWYREFIVVVESPNPTSNPVPDPESVYASVGYCLYALGLFEEAIAWSKSCSGPHQLVDTLCRALIEYEAQLQGGCLQAVERAASRTRYTASAFDPARAEQLTPRLKQAMETLAPFQENYIDWISSAGPMPALDREGYPFFPERDAGNLTRHRMNLLCATCYHADALIAGGHTAEAKQLLSEAALLEPRAAFIQDRLKLLP